MQSGAGDGSIDALAATMAAAILNSSPGGLPNADRRGVFSKAEVDTARGLPPRLTHVRDRSDRIVATDAVSQIDLLTAHIKRSLATAAQQHR
jgi:hypothetical protein